MSLFHSSSAFDFSFKTHSSFRFLVVLRSSSAPAMVSADAARTVVGVLGNIIALFLFLSPVPTFVQIWKKGSVEQYSAAPYLATLVNCMVWTLYGLPMVHPHSTLVVTINGTGTAIEIAYIILFLIYSDPQKRLRVLLLVLVEFIFVSILTILVLTLAHTHKERSMIVGIVCFAFNVMMYASPLTVMKLVIYTKSVEYMPFFLSFASFANGLAWTAYALIRFDPFIAVIIHMIFSDLSLSHLTMHIHYSNYISTCASHGYSTHQFKWIENLRNGPLWLCMGCWQVPNAVGALFSIAQLLLYATFYRSTKRQIAARKLSKGVILDMSEVVVAADQEYSKKEVGSAGPHDDGSSATA